MAAPQALHCATFRQPHRDDSQRGYVSCGWRQKAADLRPLLVCLVWQHWGWNQIYLLAITSGGFCKPNCARASAKQEGIFGLFQCRCRWAIAWAVCSLCSRLSGGTASGNRTAGCSNSSWCGGLWSMLPARASRRQLKQLMKREFGLVEHTAFYQPFCCFCQTEICLTMPGLAGPPQQPYTSLFVLFTLLLVLNFSKTVYL